MDDDGRVCAANGGSGPGELDLSWWKLVVQAAGIFFRSCFFFLRSLEEFMLSWWPVLCIWIIGGVTSIQWHTVDIGTRFSTAVHDSFYIFSAFNFLFLSSNERFVLLFAFAFRFTFSRDISRALLKLFLCRVFNSVAAAATTLHVLPLLSFRWYSSPPSWALFKVVFFAFFPFSSSTDFLLTSSSNHQTTARIIVLCVKCFCFCCDYQQPLWLRCVAFVWLLWRSSKNVPSCRLDSGHFDRPTEMIHTVWRKLKKSILVVLRPLLFNSSFEIAPPLSDLSTSLSNLNPLN